MPVFPNDVRFLEFSECNTKFTSMLCNHKFFRLIKGEGGSVTRRMFTVKKQICLNWDSLL